MSDDRNTGEGCPWSSRPPKIIQLLLTPNDSDWQGALLGLADNGDTYRLDHADGWVIWFDGISKANVQVDLPPKESVDSTREVTGG